MIDLRLHRIRITDDAVAEYDGLPLVHIPRSRIRSVALLADAPVAEHRWLFVLGAIACAAGAVIGAILLIGAADTFPRTGAGALALAPGVPLLLRAALRRGPVLRVETDRGVRKLGFGAAVTSDELAAFVATANEAGCSISTAQLPAARALRT